MNIEQWQPGDFFAAGGLLLAISSACVAFYRYIRRGPKLAVEIIPPRKNCKNKKDSDRIITVAVTNQGDQPANIYKLQIRTLDSRFLSGRKVVNEAVFDDSTPWKPSAKLDPFDSKTYDLQFFSGWNKDHAPALQIEVAVFIRANPKPAISRIWG